MERAAELLLESDEPIQDVMGKVGYTEKKAFYEHFKNMYGVTPGQYRKSPASPKGEE